MLCLEQETSNIWPKDPNRRNLIEMKEVVLVYSASSELLTGNRGQQDCNRLQVSRVHIHMWQRLYGPCFITQASCWVPSLTAEVRHCSLTATSHGALPEEKTADGNPFHFCFSSFTHLNFQGNTDLWPQEVIGKVNYVLHCWVGCFFFFSLLSFLSEVMASYS